MIVRKVYKDNLNSYCKKKLNLFDRDLETFNKLNLKEKGVFIRKLLC